MSIVVPKILYRIKISYNRKCRLIYLLLRNMNVITPNARIAKNTLFLSLRMVLVFFVSLYTSRVFLNVLGVVDYGISNVVAGFVSMFGFLNTSMASSIQRFYSAEIGTSGKSGITKVYNSSLLIQIFIATGIFVLLETIGLWYLREKMVIPENRTCVAFWLYQLSVISAIIVVVQSPFSAIVMAYEKMNVYAAISVLEVLLKLAFALALPYIDADRLLMYGVFYMFITLLSFLLYFVYAKVHYKELYFQRVPFRGMLKEMVTFSGWSTCGTFACMVREQGLNIVLNLFFGPVVNAARGIAYQVSSALQGFVSNISLASRPQIVQSFAIGDKDRTIKLMYSMTKISFVLLFILAIPIVLNINYVLSIWLGDVVPEHTANFIILIVMINFLNNLNTPLSNVVYATGKMRAYELTFSIINILILPLSYVALKFGAPPESVFVIYLIMAAFVQIGCLIIMRKLVSLPLLEYSRRIILPMLVTSLILIPILYIINSSLPETFWRLLVLYCITFFLSGISFYFIVLNNSERTLINSFILKIVNRK